MKEKILKLSFQGKTIAYISKYLKRAYITIHRIIKEIKNSSCIKRRMRTGPRHLLNKPQIKKVLNEAKKNGKKPAKNIFIASNVMQNFFPSCSTIRGGLTSGKIKSRICSKNPNYQHCIRCKDVV